MTISLFARRRFRAIIALVRGMVYVIGVEARPFSHGLFASPRRRELSLSRRVLLEDGSLGTRMPTARCRHLFEFIQYNGHRSRGFIYSGLRMPACRGRYGEPMHFTPSGFTAAAFEAPSPRGASGRHAEAPRGTAMFTGQFTEGSYFVEASAG